MSHGSVGRPRFLFIRCDEDSDRGYHGDRNSTGSTVSEVDSSGSPSSANGASDGTVEKDVSEFLHRSSDKRNTENRPSQSETYGYRGSKTRDSFTDVSLRSSSKSRTLKNEERCQYCDSFQHERQYFLWRSQYTRSSYCTRCSEKKQFISYWGRPSYENGSWRKRLKEGRNVDIDLTPLIEVLHKIDSIDTSMGRPTYNTVGSNSTTKHRHSNKDDSEFISDKQEVHSTPYTLIDNEQEAMYRRTDKAILKNGDDNDVNVRKQRVQRERCFSESTSEEDDVFLDEINSKSVAKEDLPTAADTEQHGGLISSLETHEMLSKTDVNLNNNHNLTESYSAQNNDQYDKPSEIDDADKIVKSNNRHKSQLNLDQKLNQAIEIDTQSSLKTIGHSDKFINTAASQISSSDSNVDQHAENCHSTDSAQNNAQTENNACVKDMIAQIESESGSGPVKTYRTLKTQPNSDQYSSFTITKPTNKYSRETLVTCANDSKERKTKHAYGLAKNDHAKDAYELEMNDQTKQTHSLENNENTKHAYGLKKNDNGKHAYGSHKKHGYGLDKNEHTKHVYDIEKSDRAKHAFGLEKNEYTKHTYGQEKNEHTKHAYGLDKNEHTIEQKHLIKTECSNITNMANKDGDDSKTAAHTSFRLNNTSYSTTKKTIKGVETDDYKEPIAIESKQLAENSTELNQNVRSKPTLDEIGKSSVSGQGSHTQRHQQKRRLSRSQRDRRSSIQRIRMAQEFEDDEFLKIQQKVNMLGRFSKTKSAEIKQQEMTPAIQIPKTIWNKSIRNAIYGVARKNSFEESQTSDGSVSTSSSDEPKNISIKTSSYLTQEVKHDRSSEKENDRDEGSLTNKSAYYMSAGLNQKPVTMYHRSNTLDTHPSLTQFDKSKSTNSSCETFIAERKNSAKLAEVNYHRHDTKRGNQANSKERVLESEKPNRYAIKHDKESDQDEDGVVLDSNDKDTHKLNWRSRGYSYDFFMSRQSRTGAEIIEHVKQARSNRSSRNTTPSSSSASSRKSSSSGRPHSRFATSSPCSRRNSRFRILTKMNSLEEETHLPTSAEGHGKRHRTTSDRNTPMNSRTTDDGINVEQLTAALERAANCTSRLDSRLDEHLR